jgi:hypothetical protein
LWAEGDEGRMNPAAIASQQQLLNFCYEDLGWLRMAAETKNITRKSERRPPSVVTQHENKYKIAVFLSSCTLAVLTSGHRPAIFEDGSRFVRSGSPILAVYVFDFTFTAVQCIIHETNNTHTHA